MNDLTYISYHDHLLCNINNKFKLELEDNILIIKDLDDSFKNILNDNLKVGYIYYFKDLESTYTEYNNKYFLYDKFEDNLFKFFIQPNVKYNLAHWNKEIIKNILILVIIL